MLAKATHHTQTVEAWFWHTLEDESFIVTFFAHWEQLVNLHRVWRNQKREVQPTAERQPPTENTPLPLATFKIRPSQKKQAVAFFG